jgi:hypothetical protein
MSVNVMAAVTGTAQNRNLLAADMASAVLWSAAGLGLNKLRDVQTTPA